MEKEVHVLSEAITLHSRAIAIAIEVVVFVFGSVWVVCWYLEWRLLGPPSDCLVCIIWICVGL